MLPVWRMLFLEVGLEEVGHHVYGYREHHRAVVLSRDAAQCLKVPQLERKWKEKEDGTMTLPGELLDSR